MIRLRPGDRVDVRIKSARIVSPYEAYDEIRTFEIIASDAYGYYIYIPHFIYLNTMIDIDDYYCDLLNINKKFLHENCVYIKDSLIVYARATLDGIKCIKCQEFYRYAEANQPDGESLICWSCRFNRYR